MDSYEFKATLLDFFSGDSTASKHLEELDWDSWFYKPGFPPKPDYDTSMVDECYALADRWHALNAGDTKDWAPNKEDISSWMANQTVVFLERVQTFDKPLSPQLVEKMGSVYEFEQSKNVEIVSRYLVVGLKAHAEAVYKPTADLLGKVGRMKFVRPMYKGLLDCDKKLAKATFEKHRDFYHPICRNMIEKLFEGKVGGD